MKTTILLIIVCSCLFVKAYSQKNSTTFFDYSITNSCNLLTKKSALLIKKHATIIAVMPTIAYYYKDIINIITKHPYISSLGFYFLLHYICDTILGYENQQHLLHIISLLKKISLYLVITHGIKNYIHEKNLYEQTKCTEQEFLNSMTENLAYSFDEISHLILKFYQEIKMSLHTLNIAINIESEELIFLCHPSSITIHNVLYLVQCDPVLYQDILQFEQHPQIQLTSLIKSIKFSIDQTFNKLQQELNTSNIKFHFIP